LIRRSSRLPRMANRSRHHQAGAQPVSLGSHIQHEDVGRSPPKRANYRYPLIPSHPVPIPYSLYHTYINSCRIKVRKYY
jgi:hypothetical protein